MLMPVFDLLNHSLEPNVAILPYHDALEDKSFLVLKALREIQPNEQLMVSYGDLSNMHLIQKYGFTSVSSLQSPLNVVQASYSYGDYQQIVYKEQLLKRELAEFHQLSFNPERLLGVQLFSNKFDPNLLRRLRLTFLTSKTIMDIGGTEKLRGEIDFKADFD